MKLHTLTLALVLALTGCNDGTVNASKAAAQLASSQTQQSQTANAFGVAGANANAANPVGPPQAAVSAAFKVVQTSTVQATPAMIDSANKIIGEFLSGNSTQGEKDVATVLVEDQSRALQIATLQGEVKAAQDKAADAEREKSIAVWQARLLLLGSLSYGLALILAAAGAWTSVTKFYYASAATGTFATMTFLAAYEADSKYFGVLAFGAIVGLLASVGYAIYYAIDHGSTLQTNSSGFTNVLAAVEAYCKSVGPDALKLVQFMDSYLDRGEKDVVNTISGIKTWVESLFTKTPAAKSVTSAPVSTPPAPTNTVNFPTSAASPIPEVSVPVSQPPVSLTPHV